MTERDEFTDSLLDRNDSIQDGEDQDFGRKTTKVPGYNSKSRPTTLRMTDDLGSNQLLRNTINLKARKQTMTNEQKNLFLKGLASGEFNPTPTHPLIRATSTNLTGNIKPFSYYNANQSRKASNFIYAENGDDSSQSS